MKYFFTLVHNGHKYTQVQLYVLIMKGRRPFHKVIFGYFLEVVLIE